MDQHEVVECTCNWILRVLDPGEGGKYVEAVSVENIECTTLVKTL